MLRAPAADSFASVHGITDFEVCARNVAPNLNASWGCRQPKNVVLCSLATAQAWEKGSHNALTHHLP